MRDFRDAKTMAQTIRATLAAQGLQITVGQSLELTAKAFGLADWNQLSAAINAGSGQPRHSLPVATPTITDRPIALEFLGFSRELQSTLHRTVATANQRGHEQATLEHLLLASLDDGDAAAVMNACRVDVEVLRTGLSRFLDEQPRKKASNGATPTAGFQRTIQRAVISIKATGLPEVTGANLLVSLFSERESRAVQFLQEQDMTRYDAVDFIAHGRVKPGGDAAA